MRLTKALEHLIPESFVRGWIESFRADLLLETTGRNLLRDSVLKWTVICSSAVLDRVRDQFIGDEAERTAGHSRQFDLLTLNGDVALTVLSGGHQGRQIPTRSWRNFLNTTVVAPSLE